jgi:sortase (surface protein transpeptidase)
MKNSAKTVKIITSITIAIAFICIVILTCQFIKIANMKNTEKELQTQKEQLIEDIYNYNTTNSYYNNNRTEFLEDYAREHLVWGEPNETWYVKK